MYNKPRDFVISHRESFKMNGANPKTKIKNPNNMVRKFDFLVIGSGIAGMSFALKVAEKGSVALICKAGLEEANTYFAQGGIASVTNLKVDNFDKHIEDTMIAGDWISDRAAVEKVVKGAPGECRLLRTATGKP